MMTMTLEVDEPPPEAQNSKAQDGRPRRREDVELWFAIYKNGERLVMVKFFDYDREKMRKAIPPKESPWTRIESGLRAWHPEMLPGGIYGLLPPVPLSQIMGSESNDEIQ